MSSAKINLDTDFCSTTYKDGKLMQTRNGLHISKQKYQGHRFVNQLAIFATPKVGFNQKRIRLKPLNQSSGQARKLRPQDRPAHCKPIVAKLALDMKSTENGSIVNRVARHSEEAGIRYYPDEVFRSLLDWAVNGLLPGFPAGHRSALLSCLDVMPKMTQCTNNQNNLTALTTILAPEWVDNPQTREGLLVVAWQQGKVDLDSAAGPTGHDICLGNTILRGSRVAEGVEAVIETGEGVKREVRGSAGISILTLSSTGVCQLLQMGHWIPITSDTIDRKSNFNPFEKGLVVLQVYWFATQCITRKIYGLPISLLELHTVIHILSAGIMYSFWFNKPLDIREPEVLDDMTGEVLEVMAHMSLLSKNLRRQLDRLTFYGALTDFYNDASNNGTQSNSKTAVSLNLKHLYSVEYIQRDTSEGINLRGGQALPCGIGVKSGEVNISAIDAIRLERIACYISQIRPVPKRRRLSDIVDDLGGDYFEDASILAAPKHNLYIEKDAVDLVSSSGCQKQSIFNTTWMALVSYLELTLSHWTNILLALTFPTLYGGAHLMAVGTSFPSIVELHIWKAACFVIVGGIPCLWVILFIELCISSTKEKIKP
ncbi:hypothetical protein TruAng_011186 [Truncatella angustata]|nr:hypothetical protein TruAng_011186 [Truncatella angustata]